MLLYIAQMETNWISSSGPVKQTVISTPALRTQGDLPPMVSAVASPRGNLTDTSQPPRPVVYTQTSTTTFKSRDPQSKSESSSPHSSTTQVVISNPPAASAVERWEMCDDNSIDGKKQRTRPRCSKPAFMPPGGTACPSDLWVDDMVKHDPDPEKVGCHSGHDAILWLQRFDQHGFWNTKQWTKQIGQRSSSCRHRMDLKSSKIEVGSAARPKASTASQYPVSVCVEAVPRSFQRLVATRRALGYDGREAPGTLHIVHALAVGEASPNQSVLVSDVQAGWELDGMSDAKGARDDFAKVLVPAKTVDGIVASLGLSKVDVLAIDADGADPAVLMGALGALRSVRYLTFEVHRDLKGTRWEITSLISILELLSKEGFDCYWAGDNGNLVSATHCWRSSFEASICKRRANIACVKRHDSWWNILEKFCPGSKKATVYDPPRSKAGLLQIGRWSRQIDLSKAAGIHSMFVCAADPDSVGLVMRPRCSKPALRPPLKTECPDDRWVDAMIQQEYEPGKVIVNVGCNKGNDAVSWLQRFDQHGFWSTEKWIAETSKGSMKESKHFCYARRKFPAPPKAQSSSSCPISVCVEAVPRTFQQLVATSHALGYDSKKAPGTLHIVHAAVVDAAAPNETLLFSDAPAGWELEGVNNVNILGSSFAKVPVPAKTVDGIVEELKLRTVDVLLIDTEGADPAVLMGATNTLDTVRYVQIEIHRDLKGTHWANTSLLSVAIYLDSKGFDCYWPGNAGKLTSLTHCWEDRLELTGWANVVCGKRNDTWLEQMEKFCPGSELGMR